MVLHVSYRDTISYCLSIIAILYHIACLVSWYCFRNTKLYYIIELFSLFHVLGQWKFYLSRYCTKTSALIVFHWYHKLFKTRFKLNWKHCRSRSFESQLTGIHTVIHTTCHCEFTIFNKNMKYRITLTLFILVTGQVTCPELNVTRSDKLSMVFPQPWLKWSILTHSFWLLVICLISLF